MNKHIYIQESCPRDGWQNHKQFIATEIKIKYINKMLQTGAKELEVTSFVNSRLMPQMADAAEVFATVRPIAKARGCKLSALALNRKGAEKALAAGADTLAFVLSASEEHNLRNSHRSLQESMEQFKLLVGEKYEAATVLCIACSFGSPFGDAVTQERLQWLLEEAQGIGIKRFGLADTAGICNPQHMRETLKFLKKILPVEAISIHLHDTYGMGLANAFVALEEGITHFDAALAGMGGCPFAPGAKGNIATEDLVYLCEGMGLETDYSLEKLIATATAMCGEITAENVSAVSRSWSCHK